MKVLLVLLGLMALSSAGYVRNRVAPKVTVSVQQPLSEQEQQQPIRINVEQEQGQRTEVSGFSSSSDVEREEEKPAPVPVPEQAPPKSRTYTTIRNRENVAAVVRSERPQPQQQHQQQQQQPQQRQQPMSASEAKARQEAAEQEALEEEEREREALEHARTIKYSFATALDDGIMDQSQVREESRDGSKVTGSYKYSDGFVKRVVHYVADENGYRIVSEESEPIGNGPQVDLVNGKADIHTSVQGVDTKYSIHADDIVLPQSSTASPESENKKSSPYQIRSKSPAAVTATTPSSY